VIPIRLPAQKTKDLKKTNKGEMRPTALSFLNVFRENRKEDMMMIHQHSRAKYKASGANHKRRDRGRDKAIKIV